MYQRAQLKEEVKLAMRGTRPRPMWVALLFTVIVAVGSWLISTVINAVSGINVLSSQLVALIASGYEIEEALEQLIWIYSAQIASVISTIMICSILVSLLTALWNGLMSLGFKGYCLSMVRGEQPPVNRLFCGFPLIGKVLLTRFLVWVFTFLWTLLYAVCFGVVVLVAALLVESVPAVSVILMLLGYIAIIVLEVRLTLRYALADYVLLDQGVYGLEAVTASKVMMKGNKGRLFVLQLSFVGWYLIEAAILWLGMIIIFVMAVAAGGGYMHSGGFSYGAMAGMVGGALAVLVLMLAGCVLFGSWLLPYTTGAIAKFYEFLKGEQAPPVESGWPTLGGDSTSYTRTDDTGASSGTGIGSGGGSDNSGGPIYPQY